MRNDQRYIVEYISSLIKDADYVYFISYAGLTVKAFAELRTTLAGLGAECHVLKNTLIRKAGEALSIEGIAQMPLTEGTAMISGKGDAAEAAKAIVTFGKTFNNVAPKGGYFEGEVLSAEAVADIATLPSKPVLQAMLLGVLQAPSRNLVSVLNAKAASILNVLNAYKNKIQE